MNQIEERKIDNLLKAHRKAKKKAKLSARGDAADVSVPSPQDSSGDVSQEIHVGGIHPFHERLDGVVELMNRLYPIPEDVLREDTESTFYIFQVSPLRVLKRGVRGYENSKREASLIRKRMGLRFDEVKFKKEKKTSAAPSNYGRSGGTYRGGHVETSRHYNPSKRGRFRGVSYSDGSYADLD